VEAIVHEEGHVTSQVGPADIARGWMSVFRLWVGIMIGVVEILLGFRLGFLLSGANPGTDFVEFIYDASGPLIQPFEGIASNRAVNGDGIFEPATVVAMVVYFVAAVLLMAVLWAAFIAPASTERRTVVTRTRSQHGAHS
jgi:hypothetical protein